MRALVQVLLNAKISFLSVYYERTFANSINRCFAQLNAMRLPSELSRFDEVR